MPDSEQEELLNFSTVNGRRRKPVSCVPHCFGIFASLIFSHGIVINFFTKSCCEEGQLLKVQRSRFTILRSLGDGVEQTRHRSTDTNKDSSTDVSILSRGSQQSTIAGYRASRGTWRGDPDNRSWRSIRCRRSSGGTEGFDLWRLLRDSTNISSSCRQPAA